MKVDALFSQNLPPGGSGGSLIIQADVDFPRTLTLGQIIKGRVLRSYEGSRYLMEFSGREHVVDSTIPLKRGEIVHGRVIGLGERVELRRVAVDNTGALNQDEDAPAHEGAARSDRWTQLLQELFDRYQAKLGIEDQALLRESLPRAGEPEQLALSALILSKLGLRLAPELLQAIFLTLITKQGRSLFPTGEVGLQLTTATQAAPGQSRDEAMTALAVALQAAIMPVPEVSRPIAGGAPAQPAEVEAQTKFDARQHSGSRQRDLTAWSRRILNAQTGGAMAHRVNSIPLLVNGRLIELDVALFEQRDAPQDTPQGMTHRQILFSLTTENLGTVEVKATLAGDHMRASLSTPTSDRTLYLSAHSGVLSADLEALGWQVDELTYLTQEHNEDASQSAVLRSVAEHIISPGSVRRWV